MSQRLLVIERDERSCEDVMRRLACWHGGIDSFADPERATRALGSRPEIYAAAIVGAVLPKMSGIEWAMDIRRLKPDLPVVLATTRSIARYLNAQQDYPIAMALCPDSLADGVRAIVNVERGVRHPQDAPARPTQD